MLAILLLVQTAPRAAPELIVIEASPADRAAYASRALGCADTLPRGDEVVVCARMADMPKSLEEQAAMFEPRPFRPAWRMLGGEGGVALQRGTHPMSNATAVMGTFKLKF